MSETDVTNSIEISGLSEPTDLAAELTQAGISGTEEKAKRGRKPKTKFSQTEIDANPEALQEKMLIWFKDQLEPELANNVQFLQTFATKFVGYVSESTEREKRLEIERLRLRMEVLGIKPEDLAPTPTGTKKAAKTA